MKQIVIVQKSRPGLLADISEALGAKGINIDSFNLEESSGLDIVTLTVDRYNEALDTLRQIGIEGVTEDVVLIRVKDEPGSLAGVAKRFRDANIHVRSMRIISREAKQGIVAISMDRTKEALAVVEDLLVHEAQE